MLIEEINYLSVITFSILFGAYIGVIHSIFSFFTYVIVGNQIGKKDKFRAIKAVASFLWDFLFFLLITPLCAIFIFGVNYGIVRWYIVASVLIGFFVYSVTIGYVLKKLTSRVALFLHEAVRKTTKKLILMLKKIKIERKRKTKKKETEEKRLVYSWNRR